MGASTIGIASDMSRRVSVRFVVSFPCGQAFEMQIADGGVWKSILATASNNLNSTKYFGPAVSGHVLRIRMTKVVEIHLSQ